MTLSINEDIDKYEYKDIAKAVGYWVVLNDFKSFFKDAEMHEVHSHIAKACDAIDEIWRNFDSDSN